MGAFDAAPIDVRPWDGRRFQSVRKLEDAPRNGGVVDLSQDLALGNFAAVKRMPLSWTAKGPRAFAFLRPDALENPWHDVRVLNELQRRGFAYACEFRGVFRDEQHLYVALSWASEGDLFAWCASIGAPHAFEREAIVRPVVAQLLVAVQQLHDLGIAHRDLSLENVLLDNEDGCLRLKVIDFGMATSSRFCTDEVRGKSPYRAPEMHGGNGAYDAFLADAFALGVVVFGLNFSDYPWASTKPGQCRCCDAVARRGKNGIAAMLEKRKLSDGSGKSLKDSVSSKMADLLKGLLDFDESTRFALGERCWKKVQLARTDAASMFNEALGTDAGSSGGRDSISVEDDFSTSEADSCRGRHD